MRPHHTSTSTVFVRQASSGQLPLDPASQPHAVIVTALLNENWLTKQVSSELKFTGVTFLPSQACTPNKLLSIMHLQRQLFLSEAIKGLPLTPPYVHEAFPLRMFIVIAIAGLFRRVPAVQLQPRGA